MALSGRHRARPPGPVDGDDGPAVSRGWRVARTRRGARIEQHGVLLSEVAARAGPTHTLFDVLAAALVVLARGPRLGLLGFAGGSVVAPLRALGVHGPLSAVDLSRAGEPLFRSVCGAWAGRVHLAQDDAARWLARGQARFDALLEDLSVPTDGDLVKPEVCFARLPALAAARLGPDGVYVANLLPTPGWPFTRALPAVRAPFAHALEVRLRDYTNRLVLAAQRPLPARDVGRALAAALARLRSRQHGGTSVRRLPA